MKKLIITLMALAVLFSLAVPAMAASPVKDYATAQDGDLLYTVNFNGDEAFTGVVSAGFKYHDITPLSNGAELEIKGNKWHDYEEGKWAGGEPMNTGNIYAGAINGLAANATTKYTMTYQIWINETNGGLNTHGGADCYVGVGGLVEDPAASSQKWINFTSNYFTENADNRAYSLRSRSAKLKDAEGNDAVGVFAETVTPVKIDGYYTVRLTFDGTTATVTAYILTNGTGAKDSDWTKLTAAGYNVGDANNMAFAVYCQSSALHCKIKNVNIYKGLVTGVADTSAGDST
ncbi:MAG: hypothetical protein J6K03_05755, partial [Oscillospiraceae bacterium]|nr:hypothetical protein [Oscillospiraceae bacterium]